MVQNNARAQTYCTQIKTTNKFIVATNIEKSLTLIGKNYKQTKRTEIKNSNTAHQPPNNQTKQ
jgi:hypothetical protein